MAFPPILPNDPFENAALNLSNQTQLLPGYNPLPADYGSSNASARKIPQHNGVLGSFNRSLIQWFVPEQGMVEMYINPQNIQYKFKKNIEKTRTKGGFILQYWGEDLTSIGVRGTTGSSGIEGINALLGVYRSEQIAFDPYALAVAASNGQINNPLENLSNGNVDLQELFNLGSGLIDAGQSSIPDAPTLADLAFSVEMYYAGWIFRGFFENFNITEKSESIGLFDYEFDFTVTQMKGNRRNFFAWHRNPLYGPSNSDPNFGVPYSYNGLEEGALTSAKPFGPIKRTSAEEFNDRLESGDSIFSLIF